MRYVVSLLLVLLVMASPLFAIVRRHDRDDSRYLELAKAYNTVVDLKLPGGAGTLIARTWVLTAAHAAHLLKLPHEVRINGRGYEISQIITYPGGGEGKDDIALLQLATPVKDVEPAVIYEGREEATGNKVVTFVGQGFAGDGQTGPVLRDGRRRAATNELQAVKQNWLIFLFDAPPGGTDLEGISGPGDSGGPAFMEKEGVTYLIGVSSGQDSRATGKEGVYGVTEYYVRVSSYVEWIRKTVAAPHKLP